jgi:hypothetical protein
MIDLFVYDMPIVTEVFRKGGKPQDSRDLGVIATLCSLCGEYIALRALHDAELDATPLWE